MEHTLNRNPARAVLLILLLCISTWNMQAFAETKVLLNSSYDIARELFARYNAHFEAKWQREQGETIEVKQLHGGSSRQAQSIIQGLRADVVTYNQVPDVDILHARGELISRDWKKHFPNNSSPYYSTLAYLVRAGNPHAIQNWDDLIRTDVTTLMPNPKTSGNGRYTYLAAYGFAQEKFANDQSHIDDFMQRFLSRVALFDNGGRDASDTFVEKRIGDVLLTFESEANNILKQHPDQGFEVVVPPVSILAEFPVAVVEKQAARVGNLALAHAYLQELYSEESQRILATFNYRVHHASVKQEFASHFPKVRLLRVEEIADSWGDAMRTHFANGGEFDQLLARTKQNDLSH